MVATAQRHTRRRTGWWRWSSSSIHGSKPEQAGHLFPTPAVGVQPADACACAPPGSLAGSSGMLGSSTLTGLGAAGEACNENRVRPGRRIGISTQTAAPRPSGRAPPALHPEAGRTKCGEQIGFDLHTRWRWGCSWTGLTMRTLHTPESRCLPLANHLRVVWLNFL